MGLCASRHEAAGLGQHHGVDEHGLRGKASIQRGPADAAAPGDVFHRGAADADEFGLLEGGSQDAGGELVGLEELSEQRGIGFSQAPDELLGPVRR